MATKKFSELPEADDVSLDDLVAVVDNPGGTPESQKATLQQIFDAGAGIIQTAAETAADTAETNANAYTDTAAATAESNANAYTDTAESDANSYTDTTVAANIQITCDAYASFPGSPPANAVHYPTDGYGPWIYKGGVWRPIINGVVGYEPPSISGWTHRSHGGISSGQVPTKTKGLIKHVYDNYNGGGEEVRITTHAMPAGAFSVVAWMRFYNLTQSGTQCMGLTFRESSTGSIEQWVVEQPTNMLLTLNRHRATANNTGTSPTYSFSADAQAASIKSGAAHAQGIWLKMTDDRAGNRNFYWSENGVDFQEAAAQAVTSNAFITADEVGFTAWVSGASAGATFALGALVGSYKEN
jgi:hypothetical protein